MIRTDPCHINVLVMLLTGFKLTIHYFEDDMYQRDASENIQEWYDRYVEARAVLVTR